MARVYVSPQCSLEVSSLRAAVERGAASLGGAERLLSGVGSVLVKPNFAVARNPDRAITNSAVLEAVLGVLRDCGVRQLIVGDGCGGGAKAQPVFEVSGMVKIAPRYGADLVDLTASEQVELPVPGGDLFESVSVAREAAECDLIVNVPCMKTHLSTLISIAMRNLKGVLNWPTKRQFHQRGLFRSIVDLNRVPWRQLVVVDGTRAMEGWGPFDGELVPVNRLVMGQEALAVDVVCARIMGFEPAEVDTIRLALEAGLGTGEPEVVGESVAAVQAAIGRPFTRPPFDQTLDLGYARLHVGDKVCTGCHGQAGGVGLVVRGMPGMPARYCVDYYLGNVRPEPAAPGRVAVYWGSCAVREARHAGLAESEDCLHIPGCPPDPEVLFQKLGQLPRLLSA